MANFKLMMVYRYVFPTMHETMLNCLCYQAQHSALQKYVYFSKCGLYIDMGLIGCHLKMPNHSIHVPNMHTYMSHQGSQNVYGYLLNMIALLHLLAEKEGSRVKHDIPTTLSWCSNSKALALDLIIWRPACPWFAAQPGFRLALVYCGKNAGPDPLILGETRRKDMQRPTMPSNIFALSTPNQTQADALLWSPCASILALVGPIDGKLHLSVKMCSFSG